MIKMLLIILTSLVKFVTSYSSGAPLEICNTLTPGTKAKKLMVKLLFNVLGHGLDVRDHRDLPYKLTLSGNKLFSNESLTITISGANSLLSTEFKGFIIQVVEFMKSVCNNPKQKNQFNDIRFPVRNFPH